MLPPGWLGLDQTGGVEKRNKTKKKQMHFKVALHTLWSHTHYEMTQQSVSLLWTTQRDGVNWSWQELSVGEQSQAVNILSWGHLHTRSTSTLGPEEALPSHAPTNMPSALQGPAGLRHEVLDMVILMPTLPFLSGKKGQKYCESQR